MNYYFRILFGVLMLAASIQINAEIINAQPMGVSCIASGTGAGTCDIIFSANTVTSCSNTTNVSFDPRNDTLGKEIFGMALAAVSSGKNLNISLLACDAAGKAGVDWIVFN